ncbi:helix-turn-helix transcriptional regulator [Clostridium estertheticum]|uniref:helix-turn-helix transcriptional regulator n=1 Tax=Clostridium estertheticum TaxID=238834 RepID=UPI001C0C5A77|nr:WYL domain-containing protein [Clostridium estertheticum]MBU3075881.1 WYL domain-containing protein [Clostridium estertheticum]MBU3166003.1 WYL domain-containing protein [Clostridium estertheticum]
MPKNDNMLAILWMLNSGIKITAKQISERLEINIRSVYRYMDALCVSGVPIISEPGHNGGYSLLNNFIRAPLFFNLEEKKSLLHAAVFAMESGYPFMESLNNATSKLKMFSNQEQEKVLNRHLVGFEVVSRICDPAVKPILMELEQAVANECSLEIEYCTGYEGHPKHRVVDPYGILYWNNKWYAIAFCHLRNEIRNFRVDRIINIISTKNSFKRPEAFSAREFFTESLLPNIESKVGLCTLVIEGKSEALNDLSAHWFLGYHLIKRTECKAIFLMDEYSIHTYVPHILLPYGKAIKVLEPNSFKAVMVSILKDLMDYYLH